MLYVDDAVDAYLGAWSRIDEVSGQAFNLGGGPGNAVTLLQVLAEIGEITGRKPDLRFSDWRPGDQRYFVADTRRVNAALDLPVAVSWRDGLRRLADWIMSEQRVPAMAAGGGVVKVALVNPPWTFDGSIYFGCREPHLPLELGYCRACCWSAAGTRC